MEQGYNNLNVQYQNTSTYPAQGSFKKMRNLSNENGKLQRHVSDFEANCLQSQQSHFINFSQNQISGQKVTDDSNEAYYNQNSYSATASTNDNSNSDVEIIEDDYAKSLQNIPTGLIHSRSTIVPHQTSSDYNQQPF